MLGKMKKKYRLLKSYQFKNLISTGKNVSSREFFIYYQQRSDFGEIRIGISVPKKKFTRAIARNKIRRQVKSMLVDIKKDWAIDLVIMVRKDYTNSSYESNMISLKNLLTKIPLRVR